MRGFPGHEIVEPGLADLAAGVESEAALVVGLAADRLRAAGVDVPVLPTGRPAHRLYLQLSERYGNDAHGRYGALIARVVAFARAAEHAAAR